MNRTEYNESASTAIMPDLQEEVVRSALPARNGKTAFVPKKERPKPSPEGKGRLLLIGGGITLVFLLLAVGVSHRSMPAEKKSAASFQTQNATQSEERTVSASITPILDAERSPEQSIDANRVEPDQIGRLAKERTETAPKALGDVRPFDDTQAWQPPPFHPGLESAMMSEVPAATGEGAQDKKDHEAMDKTSLIFVRNDASPKTAQKSYDSIPEINLGIDLPPGTRLRAKLESAISTAVQTPVVAVVEFNYEQNGDIAIPAGAKAFGHLETAERSGYIGIRFDSLLMPDGTSVTLQAAATDLQLRPLRGKVEGRQAGKNILVRSLAGVGEISATLVGRGSLNQPLSEDDLLRERITNNIGQASDQGIANIAVSEHIVISVPAGTEIYLVLQKSAKESGNQGSRVQLQVPTAATQPSIDELRELLQLQRELNQTAAGRQVQ